MTIEYKGIRRKTTDVLDDYGQAQHLVNVRLKRVGEMGRRAGLGKSTMAQLAGPVQFMISGWGNEPFIVNGTGGSVTGNSDPLAYWTGATLGIPDGVVGQPSAPVITLVTATPPSPRPYQAGGIIFTPTITYDGMSGALAYNWQQTVGPAAPVPSSSVANPFSTNFDAFCIPGLYSFTLEVTTQFGGFTSNLFPFDFTVS